MAVCELEDCWIQFLDFIKPRCSSAEFQNWLSPIQVIPSTKEDLVLQVPNIFVREYILDNYKKELSCFIPVKADGDLAMQFVVSEPEKKAAPAPMPMIESAQKQDESLLNPQYTFESFIEGPSNQFVKSAAQGVAFRPGKTFNPLFIHGGVGLGKTHLLHGIGHYVRAQHKKLSTQYITAESFINDLVTHLRNKSIDKMKKFYRSVDVLLIDDIQFLQNRLNFEEEFCNTFESLINQNKQIVLTSDKPPSQLKLSERMVARMEWGLVAGIGIPDLETRVAIIQQKSLQKGFSIPNSVAFFIADHIFHNVRQLEGAINRLAAHCRLTETPLTQEVAENLLKETLYSSSPNKISVESILKSVATVFEVRMSDLKGETRVKEIALARQVAMYLAKELLQESLMKLASSFGGKSHSTLLHSWKKISLEMEKNPVLKKQIFLARKNIES